MKKLLFTGASGFLGYNIRPILEKSYDVHTIGLTDDDDIKFNLAKEVPPINTHYDVVLHAAGKAHTVPKTEAEKQVFYDVNYVGTIHLCDALEKAGVFLPHPELPRRHAEFPPELQIEVGDIVKTVIHGNLHHRARRLLQGMGRFLDPIVVNVRDAAHPHILSEEAHEVALAKSTHVRQICHFDLFAVVLVDVLQYGLELLSARLRIAASVRLTDISELEEQNDDMEKFLPQQHFIKGRAVLKALQCLEEYLSNFVISSVRGSDHLRHLQLPFRKRTQILGGGQVLSLRTQKVQMEHQTVRDHCPAGNLKCRVRAIRGHQNNIPFLRPKGALPDSVIRGALPDQRDLHLLVPVERELSVGQRNKAVVAVHREKNIAVTRFLPFCGLLRDSVHFPLSPFAAK